MKLIGLTGGIASGKSTVAALLRELGAEVIDADALYHELLAPRGATPSPLASRIEARFPGVLGANATIDRKALGSRVFAAADELRALEAITHPEVARRFAERVQELTAAGKGLAIYDVPLLYERGLERGLDGVIVVWAPRAVQLERLMKRDGISEAAATQRLAAQLPLDEKRKRATWVIDNGGSADQTRRAVGALWHALQ